MAGRGNPNWTKGQSGNPGGRPKALMEVIDLARKYTVDAIEALATIVRNTEAPEAARVSAAGVLLDRGWGKAPQHLTVDDQRDAADFADPELIAELDRLRAKAAGRDREGNVVAGLPPKPAPMVH